MSIKDDNITKLLSATVKKHPALKVLGINPTYLDISYNSKLTNSMEVYGGFTVKIVFGPASLNNIALSVKAVLHKIHKDKLRTVLELVPYKEVTRDRKEWIKKEYIADNRQGIFPLLPKTSVKIESHKVTIMTDPITKESVTHVGDDVNENKMLIELSKKVADFHLRDKDKDEKNG